MRWERNAANVQIVEVSNESLGEDEGVHPDTMITRWETTEPIGGFEFELVRVKAGGYPDGWTITAYFAGCHVWRRKAGDGPHPPEDLMRGGIMLFAQDIGDGAGWRNRDNPQLADGVMGHD